MKPRDIILLSVFILLFFIKGYVAAALGFLTIASVLFINRKLLKMFTNPGFIFFIIIVLILPVAFNFSIERFIDNFIVISRGLILVLLMFFVIENSSSSKFYGKIEKLFPDELIIIIKMALNMLPALKDELISTYQSSKKLKLSNIVFNIFQVLINVSEKLALEPEVNNRVYIITGVIHGGKTTRALKIAANARNSGLKIAGIIAKGQFNCGRRSGFEILDLKTNVTKPLATIEPLDNYAEQFGPYYFYKEGFKFASDCLQIEYLNGADIIFIDEIGRMELENKGYYRELQEILLKSSTNIFIVVRDEFLDEIIDRFKMTPVCIIRANSLKNYSLSSDSVNSSGISEIRA